MDFKPQPKTTVHRRRKESSNDRLAVDKRGAGPITSTYDDDCYSGSCSSAAPRPPYLICFVAAVILSVNIAIVYSRGTDPMAATHRNVVVRDGAFEVFTADRSLEEDNKLGYATGSSSIFWMNGAQDEDYPYLCKCDDIQLAEYRAGEKEADTGGVDCAGYYSTTIWGSDDSPKCDAINSGYRNSFITACGLNLLMLLVILMTLFSIS